MIPMILVVAVLAFILSKQTPGDPAESMMVLHGITPESSNSDIEYARLYREYNLDKPSFYFSIIPDFYPANVHNIVDRTERKLTQNLLKQKIPSSAIEQYITARRNYLKLSETNYGDNESSTTLKDIILFENDADKLYESVTKRKDKLEENSEELILTINNLKSDKKNFFIPVVKWHGFNNQFHLWLRKVVKGDFGVSSKDGRPVFSKIYSAAKWTLLLAVLSLGFSLLVALPLGMWSGFKKNSLFDKSIRFISLIFYSMPVFWLASMLIIYFTSDRYGSWMNIFPTPGLWYIPEGQTMATTILKYGSQLILPIFCLVAHDVAPLSTIIRNNVVVQNTKGYVTTALAKGLKPIQVLWSHIFPNVMLPLVTVIGGRLASILSGALIVEVIFNIPGMGRLMFDSIFSADWNVVFGVLILLSIVTMTALLVTDVIYAFVDPRLRTKMTKA